MGGRIEGTVYSCRLKDQGLKAESTSVAGYGSAEHHEKFAESLEKTGANETQIRGRLAAARSEGTHPSAAVIMGKALPRPENCAQGQQRAPSGARTACPDKAFIPRKGETAQRASPPFHVRWSS